MDAGQVVRPQPVVGQDRRTRIPKVVGIDAAHGKVSPEVDEVEIGAVGEVEHTSSIQLVLDSRKSFWQLGTGNPTRIDAAWRSLGTA